MDFPREQDGHGEEEHEWTAERLARASYQELGSKAEVEDQFREHLLSSPACRSSLEALLAQGESNTTRDYSLEIDMFDLLEGAWRYASPLACPRFFSCTL